MSADCASLNGWVQRRILGGCQKSLSWEDQTHYNRIITGPAFLTARSTNILSYSVFHESYRLSAVRHYSHYFRVSCISIFRKYSESHFPHTSDSVTSHFVKNMYLSSGQGSSVFCFLFDHLIEGVLVSWVFFVGSLLSSQLIFCVTVNRMLE